MMEVRMVFAANDSGKCGALLGTSPTDPAKKKCGGPAILLCRLPEVDIPLCRRCANAVAQSMSVPPPHPDQVVWMPSAA